MLNEEILRSIQRSVLCWLATVDSTGTPNVSPKEIFRAHGEERLLVANIASPRSARNILGNPNVCVAFIDIFVQKGFKLGGIAELVLPADPRFAELGAPLEEMTGGRFPIHSIFSIDVRRTEAIVAPSYRMFPGATEASQVEAAMRTYGVNRDQRNG